MKTLSTFILISFTALLGCQPKANHTTQNNEQIEAIEPSSDVQTDKIVKVIKEEIQETKPVTTLTREGVIKFMNFEGGFFGIVTKKGEKLLPLSLSKEFHQDGALIQFSGEVQNDMVTIHQWGTPFKLKEVKLIEEREH